VVVSSEGLEGNTVESVSTFNGIFIGSSELPDHDSLVSGTSDQNWSVFIFLSRVSASNGGDPVVVTFEVTNMSESGGGIFNSFSFFHD